ncbi:cytochrome c biogenesis protein CcdA [Massilia phosphatilytica]
MAIVYTALGVAAGLVGEGLAAALQNPWVLLDASPCLIAAMSLSMFGVFQLQAAGRAADPPGQRLAGRQASGKLAGVFVMGAHLRR